MDLHTSINKENMGILDDLEKKASKQGVGIIDVLSEKILSRKLLVWVTSTIFLGFGKITPDEWMSISLGYIGVQGVADLATKWKQGK